MWRAPGAHARDEREPVVVPLLAEPQPGRAALVEANRHHQATEVRAGDRVVQPCVAARRVDRDVDAAAEERPLEDDAYARVRPGGVVGVSCSELKCELSPVGDWIDGMHRGGPGQARHLRGQEADRTEPHDRDVIAELDLRVVGRLQRDRAHADEQCRLERRSGRYADHGKGAPAGRVDVYDRLVPVRRARMDDVAGAQLLDSEAHLLDDADESVSERRGIRRALTRGHDRAELAVEDVIDERGRAAVQVQLGAVADAAQQTPDAHLAAAGCANRDLVKGQLARRYQHEGAAHRRAIAPERGRGGNLPTVLLP